MRSTNGTISDWQVNTVNGSMVGYLYNDPEKRWPEGHFIQTSKILTGIEGLKEGSIIQTKNSVYTLGKKGE